MNLFHRRPVCVFGAFLLLSGYALLHLSFEIKLALLIASALLPVLLTIRRLRPILKRAILPLTALLLASLLLIVRLELPKRLVLSKSSDEEAVVEFRIRSVQNEAVGIYTADQVTLDGRSIPLVRLLVTEADGLKAGDRVHALGSLTDLNGDNGLYYRDKGCHAVFEVTELYFANPNPNTPAARLSALSDRFLDRIREVGGERNGGLLSALLLGETDRLTDREALCFRRLGISHILAVSGMHLVTLSVALTAVFRRLGLPRSAAILINVAFMLFYTLLTGAVPSILRAFVMALVMQLGFFLGRRSDTLSSLFFSGAVLFIADPFILFSISFWLSFAATLGIVVGFIAVRRLPLYGRIAERPKRLLVTPMITTLAATLFTMPISLLVFGQISLLAIPANLLLGLPFQVLLCAAALALILGPLPFVKPLLGFLCDALLWAVSSLSSLPLAVVDGGHPVIIFASVLLVASAVVLLLLPRISGRVARCIFAGAGALLLATLPIFALPRITETELSLTTDTRSGEFFIVGDGTRRAVIGCADGGYDGAASVTEALHRDAVTELSLYVPSHYGRKTLSEVRALCRTYLVRRIALPVPSDSYEQAYFSEIAAYLNKERIPYTVFSASVKYPISNFELAVSPRTANGGFSLVLLAGEERIAYFSGAASDGIHGEVLARADAATVILGSGGILKPQNIRIEASDAPERLILCSPLHRLYENRDCAVRCTGRYRIK